MTTNARPSAARLSALAALAGVFFCVPATLAESAAAEPDLHATPTLISQNDALVAGERNLLAISFEIDPGWHIYWPGQNDTGFAFEADWQAPAGVEVGAIVWPAPHRYESEGDILDHVYEEQVTLLLPVEVAADVKPGTSVTIAAEGLWLTCEKMCIPETAELSITLPVVASTAEAQPTDHASAFEKARERHAEELKETDQRVNLRWAGSRLMVTPAGAFEWAAFYPDGDSVNIDDLFASGETDRGSLRLRPKPLAGDDTDHVSGIVEIRRAKDGPSELLRVRVPMPE